MGDIDSYKSKGKDFQLKRKILPSIFNEDGPETALAAEKEKKAEKSKTRRRQKRKHGIVEGPDLNNESEHPPKKVKESASTGETKDNELIGNENTLSKSSKRRQRKKKFNT